MTTNISQLPFTASVRSLDSSPLSSVVIYINILSTSTLMENKHQKTCFSDLKHHKTL